MPEVDKLPEVDNEAVPLNDRVLCCVVRCVLDWVFVFLEFVMSCFESTSVERNWLESGLCFN